MKTDKPTNAIDLSFDEISMLKAALMAYSKTDDVDMNNFDQLRELYGKLSAALIQGMKTALFEDLYEQSKGETLK